MQHVLHSLVVRFVAQDCSDDDDRCTGLGDSSALLRHEVAYCLGQRQDPASVQLLKDTLANDQEHPMYKHVEPPPCLWTITLAQPQGTP